MYYLLFNTKKLSPQGKSPHNNEMKRIKFFPCALELIRKSRNKPSIKQNPNNKNEKLYRFYGLTKEKEEFCVQIKENTKTRKKYLMSIFLYN